MTKIVIYIALLLSSYQLEAEVDCKASPINQGKYLNRKPPKSWTNCYGEYIYLNNASTYKGSFMNGKSDGNGVLENIAGSSYTGDWKNGQFDGRGVVQNSDGSVYDGFWVNGKFVGQGSIILPKIGKITASFAI